MAVDGWPSHCQSRRDCAPLLWIGWLFGEEFLRLGSVEFCCVFLCASTNFRSVFSGDRGPLSKS